MNWAKVLAPVAAALLLIAVVGVFAVPKLTPLHLGGNQISKFASYEELQDFVKANAQYTGFHWSLAGKTSSSVSGKGVCPCPRCH